MQFAEFALNFLEETEGDFFFRQTLIFSFSEYFQGIYVNIGLEFCSFGSPHTVFIDGI